MGVTITEVLDLTAAGEPDVLLVRAVDEDGVEFEARGWVSATTNHYDAAAYEPDGTRDPNIAPRKMTPAEVGEYAMQVLAEKYPTRITPQPAPAPESIQFALANSTG